MITRLEYKRTPGHEVKMPLGKRKRVPAARAVKTAMRVGNWNYLAAASRARKRGVVRSFNDVRTLFRRVNRLDSMIETKTAQWTSAANVNMPHNDVYVVQMSSGGDLNPLRCTNGADDPMGGNSGSRVGDRVSIKGIAIKGMVECSLQRPKVFFRIMLVKCPRGQAPTIGNSLFMGCSGNRMIDTVNTEKFTIVWQTKFNVSTSNNAPATVGGTGVVGTGTPAGIGTRTFSAWIPGYKFGRGGNIQYENTSSINPKFFDYRIAILCYDWYGTLSSLNNVGVLNELYTKMYFKDA